MSAYHDEAIAARKALDTAAHALLVLARTAINEAFIGGVDGLQLALSLAYPQSFSHDRWLNTQNMLRPLALDVEGTYPTMVWLPTVLRGVATARANFAAGQYDSAARRRELAASLGAEHARLAAMIPPRCPRDAGVVILREHATGGFVRAKEKRRGKTFAEYVVCDSDVVVRVDERRANTHETIE